MHFVRLPMTIPDVEKADWQVVTKNCGKETFFESLGFSASANFLEVD